MWQSVSRGRWPTSCIVVLHFLRPQLTRESFFSSLLPSHCDDLTLGVVNATKIPKAKPGLVEDSPHSVTLGCKGA